MPCLWRGTQKGAQKKSSKHSLPCKETNPEGSQVLSDRSVCFNAFKLAATTRPKAFILAHSLQDDEQYSGTSKYGISQFSRT